MMTRTKTILGLALALALLSAGACSKKAATGGSTAASASKLPEHFYLEAAPAGAKPVGEVKATAKTGDPVVVTGRVGGGTDVFVEGVAVFKLVDASLKPCNEDGPEDHCATPWDYCCVAPETLKGNTLTVEVAEGDQPIRENVRGFHHLDHLRTVTVKGVARKDAAGNVAVVASGVHVHPEPK
jgi:hypothetical protein